MDSMNRAANDRKAAPRSLSAATPPAFGIRWNRDIINALTRESAKQLIMGVRNSPRPRLRYDKLDEMFKKAYCNPYSPTPVWAGRRQSCGPFTAARL